VELSIYLLLDGTGQAQTVHNNPDIRELFTHDLVDVTEHVLGLQVVVGGERGHEGRARDPLTPVVRLPREPRGTCRKQV